jgi:hypothetical protein
VTRLAAAGVLVALAAAPLAGQKLQYSGSIGYASGSYTFTERTASVALLNGLSLAGERWSISATVPIVFQNTGSVTYIGGMQVPTGSGRGARRQAEPAETVDEAFQAVFGDPILRASAAPYRGFGTLRSVDLRVMAKAPVADPNTGVGTGQWDVGAGVSAALGSERTLLFADAAVWIPGDMPDLELQEYGAFSLGLGRPLGESWNGIASLSVATPMLSGLSPPVSLGAVLGHRAAEGRGVSAGVSVGLTDAAPDIAVYIGWSVGSF